MKNPVWLKKNQVPGKALHLLLSHKFVRKWVGVLKYCSWYGCGSQWLGEMNTFNQVKNAKCSRITVTRRALRSLTLSPSADTNSLENIGAQSKLLCSSLMVIHIILIVTFLGHHPFLHIILFPSLTFILINLLSLL